MIKYLSNKYKGLREEYLARSPRGKWGFVQSLGNFFLKPIGFDFLDRNFKMRWYSYGAFILPLNFFTSFIYTVWYSENLLNALLGTPCIVIGIVVKLKIHF